MSSLMGAIESGLVNYRRAQHINSVLDRKPPKPKKIKFKKPRLMKINPPLSAKIKTRRRRKIRRALGVY